MGSRVGPNWMCPVATSRSALARASRMAGPFSLPARWMGVEHQHRRIMSQDPQGVGHAAISRPIALHEGPDTRGGIVLDEVVGVEALLDGPSGEFRQLGGVPAVPSQEDALEAQLAGLLRDLRHVLVVVGKVEHLGTFCQDRLKELAEVGRPRRMSLEGHDCSMPGDEPFGELPRQGGRVVAVGVVEAGSPPGPQVVEREPGSHRALERIDETCPEDEAAHLGHPRIGRRGRNHRDLSRLADGRSGQANLGHGRPDDPHNMLVHDEMGKGCGALGRVSLVVGHHDPDPLAEEAALAIPLLGGHVVPVLEGRAEHRGLPRQRGHAADQDLCRGGRGRAHGQLAGGKDRIGSPQDWNGHGQGKEGLDGQRGSRSADAAENVLKSFRVAFLPAYIMDMRFMTAR